MKNIKNEKGFSVIEGLLITVIVSLIAGAGWYVKQSSSNARTSLANAERVLSDPKKVAKQTTPAQTTTVTGPAPTNTKPTTPAKTAPSGPTPTVTRPTDEDKQKAKSQLYAIRGQLEAYNTQYGYYPSDLSPSNFTEVCSGDCNVYTPPPGTKFVYSPTPNGCTTSAANCQKYTLTAQETNGTIILQLQSIY